MNSGYFIFFLTVIAQAPVAVVTSVSGDVQVYDRSSTYIKAAALLSLNAGDSLIVNQGSTTILYNDGKLVAYTSNARIIIEDIGVDSIRGDKPDEEQDIIARQKLFSLGIGTEKMVRKMSLRAPYDSSRIDLCVPGNTSTIDVRPTFVWRSYFEATWYELRLKIKTQTVAKLITVDTTIAYPENKEDLLPGTYLVKLLAFKNADTLARGECIFTLYDEAQIDEMNDLIGEIEGPPADEVTVWLLKAVTFQSYKMNHEAIRCYQEILSRDPGQPLILKAVAKLYNDIGDVRSADIYLSKADEMTGQ